MVLMKSSFQDSCGVASAGDKLKHIAKERANRERLKENVASSSTQEIHFSSESENYVGEYFELKDEDSQDWVKELKETIEEIPQHSWTEQFQACPFRNQFDDEGDYGWSREYSWENEYNQEESGDDWIEEYIGSEDPEEDAEKLAESATQLLSSMDMSNEKLRNSQFVKYLKRLADKQAKKPISQESINRARESFEEWRNEYRRAIDPLVDDEDRSWESWVKDWQLYESGGIGYEGFAQREFRRYQFSNDNSFINYSETALLTLIENSSSLRERILAHEALLCKNKSPLLWSALGFLQSDNEMDIQAIAAHQEALSMNQSLNDSWLGLALACINERCIPDAYHALENWLRRTFFSSPRTVSASDRNSELLRQVNNLMLQNPNDPNVLMVASVLQNLAGQDDLALQNMQRALSNSRNSSLLLNRIGAMLANQSRYQEALTYYHKALGEGVESPRIHYNIGISLMCLNRLEEARQAFLRALQLQTPVSPTHSIRPDLRSGYRTIWETLRLLCELEGDEKLTLAAELGNIDPFLTKKH